jgi:glycosyltransferase involved in cell wall biosynthesis
MVLTTRGPLLRVAQIIETLTMGGAENLAVNIANHLASNGHESHLVIIRGRDVLSDKVLPQVQVHYLEFERSSARNPFKFLISLWRGNRLVSGVITRNRISVVQTHLPGSNYWGLLLKLGKKCGVFATIHNNEEFHFGSGDNAVFAYFRKKVYQQILRRCNGVIAVSDEVRTSLVRELKAGPGEAARIAVVTNAVEIPEPISEESKIEIRDGLGVPGDVPFLLAAGRFSEQKNFRDLVLAAGELRDKGCHFHLLIAGDGEERPELLAMVEERDLSGFVAMPGNLTNLGSVMQAADIFVMSSLWEGLPLVLLEAMAAGLPVAAYGIAGIEEVLGGADEGMTVPVGDTMALGVKLADLLGDNSRREAEGRAGRAKIETDYSFTKLMTHLVDLYTNASE